MHKYTSTSTFNTKLVYLPHDFESFRRDQRHLSLAVDSEEAAICRASRKRQMPNTEMVWWAMTALSSWTRRSAVISPCLLNYSRATKVKSNVQCCNSSLRFFPLQKITGIISQTSHAMSIDFHLPVQWF